MDGESADSAWEELLSGRWAIVRMFDQDGHRHVVAERRPGEATPLTPLERVVLERRANGEALKVIAIDLGLSIATISRRLKSGMRKLGLHTTAELSRLLAR